MKGQKKIAWEGDKHTSKQTNKHTDIAPTSEKCDPLKEGG